MSEGMKFAFLATMVGKRDAAKYGSRRVTITAVGRKDGHRFVMATYKDGTVILGEPNDFDIPPKNLNSGLARGGDVG